MDRIIYIVNGNPRAPYNAEKNCNTPEHDLRLALPKVPSPRLLYILYITNGVRQKKIPAQSGGGRRRNAYAGTKGDPKRVLLSNGEDRAAKWVASKKMKKKNFFRKIFFGKNIFCRTRKRRSRTRKRRSRTRKADMAIQANRFPLTKFEMAKILEVPLVLQVIVPKFP